MAEKQLTNNMQHANRTYDNFHIAHCDSRDS